MSDVAVLTTTLYASREVLRFHHAAQMVGNAVSADHRVLVLDASPDQSVAEGLMNSGAIVRFAGVQRMGAQRRELFTLAGDIPTLVATPSARSCRFFLWTEPEKPDLIRFIPQIMTPLRSGAADIVVVGRTATSWASCPPLQAASERQANEVYHQCTGLRLDVMRGPVAFNRKALPFFANCDPSRYGATTGYIQHIAPLEAHAAGLRVIGVDVDFFYPRAQYEEEIGPLAPQMAVKWKRQFDECTDAYRKVSGVLGLPKK